MSEQQEQIKKIEILKVQNGTLRIDNDFIKLANVTSIEDFTKIVGYNRKDNTKGNNKGFRYFTIIAELCFFAFLSYVFYRGAFIKGYEINSGVIGEFIGVAVFGFLAILIASFVLFKMLNWFNPRTPIYQYSMVISSIGKLPMRLILGKDNEFAQKIADKLRGEVEKDHSTASYVFNIDQSTFEDNSQVINNQNIKYEIDMSQHHGMSKEDMEFFSGQFAKAVNDLNTHIMKTNNAELSAKLDELVQEVKSKKPNKSKVLDCYDKLKDMADGYDVVEKVASFAGLVGMAVMKM